MNKILLVYEDYADLMAVEATLKRVGFDVIGVTSEYAMADQMVAFNPDLVVGSGRGGKVNSLGVGKRLKEATRWQGKSVLIFPANFKPTPQDLIKIRVDMILEAPVPPLRLVQVLGKILGHDEAVLLERLNKAMHVESPQQKGAATGGSNSKFNLEEEAIYVKGTVEGDADEASLRPERVREDSQSFDLNNEEQEKKISFRFGDRMSSVNEEERVSGAAEEAFPDVDLKSLERELLGGGAPEVERIEPALEEEAAPMNAVETEEAELQAKARADLEKSEEKLKERIAKYQEMVADVKVPPKSTISRVEARRRLKELQVDPEDKNLNEIDKLRREFTKAMFKK
ncbi:hypothetical protein QJS83_07685 [Bdellovibrio sp. 22V]|uniref:hypothetical protein n=1 Tax=Bdellovibrio TaxID=958 RepID=UPI0025429F35|nr:hypothetical protein [Bdellovibrio sp. 22V]WII73756.1 hypothetical protein QJS83_07685 [Bdellovibrio sp. 22V]